MTSSEPARPQGQHRRSKSGQRRLWLFLVAGLLAAAGVVVTVAAVTASGEPGNKSAGAAPTSATSTAPSTAASSSSTSAGASASSAGPGRAAVSGSSSANATRGVIPALPDGPTGPAHNQATASVSSPPVRVRIPSIKVDSGLQHLGLLANKQLQSPSKWQTAGWYSGGARPGDVGPAIIAGHIDSTRGPAVFYRLTELKPGNVVFIDQANHHTLRFRVDHVARYVKRAFPTAAVYGPTPEPTLRLVTCTGDFDAVHHNYLDNLVVTAYLQ